VVMTGSETDRTTPVRHGPRDALELRPVPGLPLEHAARAHVFARGEELFV